MADVGVVIVESAPVSTGRDAQVTEAGEYRFFAGWRSDPFFFATQGILNDLQFTGTDFFADKNVCSIVLELPNSDLATKRVGLWARTLIGADGNWAQADRGALPAQAELGKISAESSKVTSREKLRLRRARAEAVAGSP
jgi:hypothetical protein